MGANDLKNKVSYKQDLLDILGLFNYNELLEIVTYAIQMRTVQKAGKDGH